MLLKSYFKYLLFRKTKYGIHAPFVYQLMNECLNSRTNQEKITAFKRYKKQFASDSTIIDINDFGAGSNVFKTNKRKIAQIAKVSGMSRTKALLINKIITYLQPKNALEIGTSLGIGTAAMKIAYPDIQITTLEGCEQTALTAKKYFEKNNFTNINLIVGNFDDLLPEITKNQTFDLVYFDGNHTEKATLQYFYWCLNSIHNNTLFIFDDIHWSDGMEKAWNEIIGNQKVTVSIDLFYIGLVFFRKESSKQHFIL